MNLRDGVHGDLVSFAVRLLHGRVVRILVGDEEGSLDVAAVGVLTLSVENVLIQLDIVVVDGVVKSDRDHLRHILSREVAGDGGAVLRAEAVWQEAHRGVAGWSSIRVVVIVCTGE